MGKRSTVEPEVSRVGRATLDVSLGTVARMFDAPDWQLSQNQGGGAVFAGRAGEVIVNIDSEETSSDAQENWFNLDSHIKDAETGHPIPYLDVRADVTCDGRAVYRDVPLLPVARPRRGTAGFHYGNNVELDPVGSYQVEVRVGPHPLLDETGQAATASFTVSFE